MAEAAQIRRYTAEDIPAMRTIMEEDGMPYQAEALAAFSRFEAACGLYEALGAERIVPDPVVFNFPFKQEVPS